MKRQPRPLKKAVVLPELLHRHLSAYAVAASAAGVGMLALSPKADARIVYTPTHEVISENDTYSLDLNNDGTVDFLIHYPYALLAKAAYGNAVRVQAGSHYPAEALKRGARIGPRQRFANSGFYGQLMLEVTYSTFGHKTVVGEWYDVERRYLGLRFQIVGKTHYGWARLNVSFQDRVITATLTGYAYETVPDKGLAAGDRGSTTDQGGSGRGDEATKGSKMARPGSLGQLALGSQGSSNWRKP